MKIYVVLLIYLVVCTHVYTVYAEVHLLMYLCLCTYMFIIAVSESRIGREARKGSRLNPQQVSILEAAFANNCYLDEVTLANVAHKTGFGVQRVRGWFNNRRRRMRNGGNAGTVPISEYISNCLFTYYIYLFIFSF